MYTVSTPNMSVVWNLNRSHYSHWSCLHWKCPLWSCRALFFPSVLKWVTYKCHMCDITWMLPLWDDVQLQCFQCWQTQAIVVWCKALSVVYIGFWFDLANFWGFCCSFRCMQLFLRKVVYITYLKSVECKGYPNMQNSLVCTCLMATSKDTVKWEQKSQQKTRTQLANSGPVD